MQNLGSRLLVMLLLVGGMLLVLWLVTPDDEESPGDSGAEQAPSASEWVVTHVVDGDTIEVRRGDIDETVRFIGIDTPERDECGYEQAREFLEDTVLGQEVVLVTGATTDRDAHGRLLRYVDYGGLDVGLGQISEGFAVARYDSRTDQPHPREDLYREADAGTVHICD